MCQSKSFWKFFVYATGFLLAAFGITLLALAIVVSRKEFAKAAGMEKIIIAYGIAFGAVMFLIGVTGWYAAKRESKCLVFIYGQLLKRSKVTFMPVYNVEMKQEDVDEMCSDSQSEWVSQFSKVYPPTLCDPAAMIITRPTKCLPLPTICKEAKNLQECSEEEKQVIYKGEVPSDLYINLAAFLETELKCTGYCGDRCKGMYLYSDCDNHDFKDKTCDEALVEVIKKNATIIGGISGACALIGCFVILSLVCLCCNKDFNKRDYKESVESKSEVN